MSEERRKVEWSLDLEHLRVRAGQIVSEAMGGAAETKTASLSKALDGTASAVIEIAFPVGRASVAALEARSPNLFEAELRYVGEVEFDVSGGAERVISLRQKGSSVGDLGALAGRAQDLRWDIALARNLPLRLVLAAGVGEATIDLSGLLVDNLRLDTGVGNVLALLPAQTRPLDVAIRGGVGQTEVRAPAAAQGQLDITGGLGGVKVCVSPECAARVEAKAGLGAIDLPERFVPMRGEKSRKSPLVWQTSNYADAEQRIIIRYRGGVGHFRLVAADRRTKQVN